MSIRVAFDHQAFVMQSYGGVSRYYTRLARALIKSNTKPHIFAPLHKNIYLSDLSSDLVTGRYVKNFPPKTATLVNLYNRYQLDKFIPEFKPNILHKTYYQRGNDQHVDLPTIITVYDMIHELLPESFPSYDVTAKWKYESVMRADHVICISESTRKDLIEIYNIPKSKTSVVHLASDIRLGPSSQPLRSCMDKPFILFVGQRGGYKNFSNFMASIALSDRLKKSFNIVCFGGGGFSYEESIIISSLGFRNDQVSQVSGDDEFLAELYSRARVFVYPSQYEGFGLPILEAMSCGCPVICSNVSSLPEVAGKAARYFDPYSVEEMASIIEALVLSDSSVDDLRRAGYDRSRVFSWEHCAQETLNIYSDFA